MRVRIHCGADQIGGSCVEVEHDGSRLVLDVGRPLTAQRGEFVPLPPVPGLAIGAPTILGVLISHGHQDHWGLIDQVHPSIPRFIGKEAADVLRAAQFWGAGVDINESGHFRHREPFALGPFTVTPHLVDHSGYDAYAFVIEAGGQTLMYSGDLRAHGRKASLFTELIDDPPAGVDVLILEGTHVGQLQEADALPSEASVEDALVERCTATAGAVVTLNSAQNIDRVVSCYRAAVRAGRTMAIDLYTAEVIAATGRNTLPRPGPKWPKVRVFIPVRQRMRVKDATAFDRTRSIAAYRVYPEEIAAKPGRFLIAGSFQGEVPRMIRSGMLERGCVTWSMWSGYLGEKSGQKLTAALAGAGVPLVQIHTSGHAIPADLQRLVAAVQPRAVVPIHTEHATGFGPLMSRPVQAQPDGTWWDVANRELHASCL